MKKYLYIMLILVAFSVMLNAQEAIDEDVKEVLESRQYIMQLKGLEDLDTQIEITRNSPPEAEDAAYFGLYLEDLTFPKAQALNYPENYGLLITGVVKDSPAWEFRLREDDVIMHINGKEVTNYATFEKIRQGLRAGDQISLALFRDGKVESLDMTLGSRGGSKPTASAESPKKRKLSAGFLGGTWIPMWINLDMKDINDLVTDPAIGFNAFREDGLLQQGLGGKITVGKNYFLGGQITWYNDTKKKTNATNPDYHIWMRHENMLGGVTLDKRIPLSKNLITSMGLMVGGAYHELEFLNSDSNYDWNNLPGTITNSNNTHFLLHKGFLIAQPRAEVMYRFLPWLGLRAEVGYAFGYPLTKDWRVHGLEEETYEVTNSPDTKYEGLTVTIGPWFGF
jgi:hypothetical protein